jgi:hypothetical protein
VKPETPEDKDGPANAEESRPWDVPAVEGGSVSAVPEAVREAARRAFDAGPPGAVIADLVFDSLLDADTGFRDEDDRDHAEPGRRRLRFGDSDGGARLTAVDDGDVVDVTLHVLPPLLASVEVRSKGPTFTVRTDDNGVVRFDVRPGLVSLVISPIRSMWRHPLQTAWVRL